MTQLEVPPHSIRVYAIAAWLMHDERRGKWWRFYNLDSKKQLAIYQQITRASTRLPDEHDMFEARMRRGGIELRYRGDETPPNDAAECFEFIEVRGEH